MSYTEPRISMHNEKSYKNRVRKSVLTLTLLVVAVTLLALNRGQWALAQEGNWTAPTVISAPPGFSWFPDLAVDAFGSVHVVWCHTIPLERRRGLQEQVYYTHWNGENWSQPNDIVPPSADIVRNAITTDLAGNVHLLFGGSVYSGFGLYHQKAPVSESWSAAAWSMPHHLNQGASYMGDIGVDSRGVIHVVYDDTLHRASEDELALADISYRRSLDGGRIWSTPIRLHSDPLIGSARPSLEIDRNDVIHVTWDEGWDRLSGESSDTYYGFYISSLDGGETWTPPTVIDHPDALVVQLTVGSDGQGGLMLVWGTTSRDELFYDELFYQWSTDGGQSWGAPSVIPRVFARPWTTPFDMYDMATDSAGHIHLLVVGRWSQDRNALLGVYHLVWDGDRWSTPERIFAATGLYPEYPQIVVHEGNQLHAVWFTREGGIWDSEANREVWYSSSQSPAPHQAVTPLPTPTPKSPTPTPSPIPTATLYPTVSLENTGLRDGLRTERDDVLRLAIALSPVALVILAVMAVRRYWLGRFRR
jgi:hypothetical protein